MNKRIRVGIIGLGSQGATYVRDHKLYEDELELCAIADVDRARVQAFGEAHGVPETGWFYSDEEFFAAHPAVDVVFICTRDRMHFSQAMRAMDAGYHLLLEKPAGVTARECRLLKEKADETGRIVVLCHVLRYAPGYRKIKELIDSGVLGEIMTIQAIEQVSCWHQAHSFIRGNCGVVENSSPLFLQKCCHDMDMITWLTGKHCRRVSSFAHLTHFTPENAPAGAPERCTQDCPVKDSCVYNAVQYYYTNGICRGETGWPHEMVVPVDYTPENMYRALEQGPYGRCVYRCGNDAVDHQVVNLDMEGDLLVNFTMSTFTGQNGRRLHIMGTKADIMADMDGSRTIELRVFGKEPEIIDITALAADLSGHGGGESHMLYSLAEAIRRGKADPDLSTIQDSIESHYICLAAEESRMNQGSSVVLEDFVRQA